MARTRTVNITLPAVAHIDRGSSDPRMWGTGDRREDWALDKLVSALMCLPDNTPIKEAEDLGDRHLIWGFRGLDNGRGRIMAAADDHARDTIKSIMWERRRWRLWGYRPVDDEDRLIPLDQLPAQT